MRQMILPTLYIDIQTLTPAGSCPECGEHTFAPDMRCLRCRRRRP